MKHETELVFVIDSSYCFNAKTFADDCLTIHQQSDMHTVSLRCNNRREEKKNYFTFSFNHIFPFCWESFVSHYFRSVFTSSSGSKQMWHEVAFHVSLSLAYNTYMRLTYKKKYEKNVAQSKRNEMKNSKWKSYRIFKSLSREFKVVSKCKEFLSRQITAPSWALFVEIN